MLIAKVTNGAVVEIEDYRKMFPNTSFTNGPNDDFLSDNGCMRVSQAVSYNRDTQRLQSCDPYISNGVVYTREAVDKTSEEITAETNAKAAKMRTERNKRLAETDYFALTDVTMDAAMTTYRQALRDITAHANWPNLGDDDWPTKP